MRESDGGGDRATVAILSALTALDDAMLRAVIVGAQTQLLDRPIPTEHTDEFEVEIVDRGEALLLHDYRALAPTTQREMRAIIHLRTVRESVRPAQQSPGAGRATTDAGWPLYVPHARDGRSGRLNGVSGHQCPTRIVAPRHDDTPGRRAEIDAGLDVGAQQMQGALAPSAADARAGGIMNTRPREGERP